MELYLDTANKEEIAFAARYGFIDGITTNPTIIAKEDDSFEKTIRRIDSQIDGKVWMQVTEKQSEKMYEQAMAMSKWARQAVIKLPMNEAGLEAAYKLTQQRIEVNMTLVYTLAQVLLAAKANVNYISPYIGRMDDYAVNGWDFILKAKQVIEAVGAQTKIIGASIRSPQLVVHLAVHHFDAVTMPFSVYKRMFQSHFTSEGLEQFQTDWTRYNEKMGWE